MTSAVDWRMTSRITAFALLLALAPRPTLAADDSRRGIVITSRAVIAGIAAVIVWKHRHGREVSACAWFSTDANLPHQNGDTWQQFEQCNGRRTGAHRELHQENGTITVRMLRLRGWQTIDQ